MPAVETVTNPLVDLIACVALPTPEEVAAFGDLASCHALLLRTTRAAWSLWSVERLPDRGAEAAYWALCDLFTPGALRKFLADRNRARPQYTEAFRTEATAIARDLASFGPYLRARVPRGTPTTKIAALIEDAIAQIGRGWVDPLGFEPSEEEYERFQDVSSFVGPARAVGRRLRAYIPEPLEPGSLPWQYLRHVFNCLLRGTPKALIAFQEEHQDEDALLVETISRHLPESPELIRPFLALMKMCEVVELCPDSELFHSACSQVVATVFPEPSPQSTPETP